MLLVKNVVEIIDKLDEIFDSLEEQTVEMEEELREKGYEVEYRKDFEPSTSRDKTVCILSKDQNKIICGSVLEGKSRDVPLLGETLALTKAYDTVNNTTIKYQVYRDPRTPTTEEFHKAIRRMEEVAKRRSIRNFFKG